MPLFVTFAYLFLKASYVEASINARKLGTLLLLITFSGARVSYTTRTGRIVHSAVGVLRSEPFDRCMDVRF